MSIDDIIDELAQAQQDFVGTRFIAPVLPGGKVRVRIEGIVCELEIDGRPEPGLAILEATSADRARVVGQPSRREVARFMALFPRVRLLLLEQRGRLWIAVPARGGTQPVQIEGIVPVRLVDGVGRFDTILARFDGEHFWFEGRDRRRERSIADYLRRSYNRQLDAKELSKPGLSRQDREAYLLAQLLEAEAEVERQTRRERARRAVEVERARTAEGRLREALVHAGAELQSFVEHGDRYQVSWTVEGRRYTSAISKDDQLSVVVAGICLSGQDRRFDLSSLVGVMREGQGVVQVGEEGMGVGEYWDAHPDTED